MFQADGLEIEAGAKRRLADEYDAAQERGEVARPGQHAVPEQNGRATSAEVGFKDRKEIHEARQIRDAERADPGVVRRVHAIVSLFPPNRAWKAPACSAVLKQKRTPSRPVAIHCFRSIPRVA